jgi:hypothetical protein
MGPLSVSFNTAALVVLSLALSALSALSACSTATPYQAMTSRQAVFGGYSETRLAPDRYRVTFSGNDLTSRDTVEGYLLYRSAELSLADGYQGFSIVERNVEHRTETHLEPDPFYQPWYGPAYRHWRPSWRYYQPSFGWRRWDPWLDQPFWDQSLTVHRVERYEVSAEIILLRAPLPTDNPRIFSAADIIARFGPQLKRPQ